MVSKCPKHGIALVCPSCEMQGRAQAQKLKHKDKLAEWGRKGALARHSKKKGKTK